MTRIFILALLSTYLITQTLTGAFPPTNKCRFIILKESYVWKRKITKQCHKYKENCDDPDFPFLECGEIRCERSVRYFPRRVTSAKKRFGCCPGWANPQGKGPGCSKLVSCITLPQRTPKPCRNERETNLVRNRHIFRLTSPPETPPKVDSLNKENLIDFLTFPLLNMTTKEVIKMSLANPDENEYAKVFLRLIERNRNRTAEFAKPQNIRFYNTYSDFANLLESFRNYQHTGSPFDKFLRYASQEEDFKDITKSEIWQQDDVFVEQRLAGVNPVSLRKLKLEELTSTHSHFSSALDHAIERATGVKATMIEMVKRGLIYVADYPLMHNITNVMDILDLDPTDRRQMTSSKSPVGFFVSVQNWFTKQYQLKALAIQTDYDASSPVFTPADGPKWLLAKEEFQRADITYVVVIEHLLKTHVVMESICLSINRHVSTSHPLYQLLKWHCRGILLVNSIGVPALLGPKGFFHNVFSIGHVGSIELLNKGHRHLSWDDTDFEERLKTRGVFDTEKLPYFPYRDDGIIIWRLIREFAKDYASLYYHNNLFVSRDKELQNMANELSDLLKGFPNRISSRRQLVDVLARFLFLPIQHHAVNYPVEYYSGFVPNMPMKLYEDPRVPSDEFRISNLAHSFGAAVQVALSFNVASLRIDKLFDYSEHLKDQDAAKLVSKYYGLLTGPVDKELRERNKLRLEDGHLTYPYFLPAWMPNSIHT